MKHTTTISEGLNDNAESVKAWEAIRRIAEKEDNMITLQQAREVVHIFTTLANIIIDQIIDKHPTMIK